ncbi:hypothetical protein PS3A_43170 [Pseudomonas sp. 3A(2025)]
MDRQHALQQIREDRLRLEKELRDSADPRAEMRSMLLSASLGAVFTVGLFVAAYTFFS